MGLLLTLRWLGALRFALAVIAIFGVTCCRIRAQQEPVRSPEARAAQPTIVFMTDFGTANDAVAICRAVIFGIAPPDVRLTDITHQVTPFQMEEAARFLVGVTPYYPAGTIFLVVVDPGVGTARKAVIVKSKKGQYFVLPDNGIITPVIERDGLESAHEISNRSWMISDAISSTFHGRDIFSPTAARLAGGWDFTQAGPEVKELVRLQPKTSVMKERGLEGDVIGLDDPYGSLITNVPGDDFKKLGYNLGDKVAVQIAGKTVVVPYVKTFMGVPVGESLLYIDSRGRVGIAVNQGNYAAKFNVAPPVKIFIPHKGTATTPATKQ
jgi:S-adenosylmethionine hydrolase